MPSLYMRIPEERVQGFIHLINLSESDFQHMLSGLASLPMNTEYTLDESVLSVKLPGDIGSEILDSVLPLYHLLADSGLAVDEFIAEVFDALENALTSDSKLGSDDKYNFENRLIKLLTIEGISARFKARTLLLGYENIFHSARVFTDLRPVFGQSPEEPPLAYVISNMLKIRYFNDENLTELHVAVEVSEIQALIDVLERAKLKVQSLKSNVNLPYIGN